MRIAVFDPYPRVCGVTTTRLVLLRAFRELGHEAEMVTCTRSGKPPVFWGVTRDHQHYQNGRMAEWGIRWFDGMPDRVFKSEDMSEALDTYDGVLLAEPKCPTLDKKADKDCDVPDYLWALKHTKRRWITCCFSSQYSEREAIFAKDLLEMPNFGGIVAIRPCHLRSLHERGLATTCPIKYIGVHPYYVRRQPDAPVPTRKAIGFIGRVVPNKGATALADIAQDLDETWSVEFYGATSIGMGGCWTLFLAEHFKSRGYEITYNAVNKKDRAEVLRPFPWTATKAGAPTVRYNGAYMRADVLDVCDQFAVNVSLTSNEFQQEQVESTGMEAMDAGCIGVHPDHQLIAARYAAVPVPGYTEPPSLGKPYALHDVLMTAVRRAESLIGTAEHHEMAAQNRRVLAEVHAPTRIARTFVELMEEIR